MRDEVLRARLEDSARTLAIVSVPSLAVLRRRVRRRRVRTGAATLAVSAVIGAVAVAVLPGIPALNRAPDATPTATSAVAGWRPAGPPPAADASPSAAPYLITNLTGQQGQPIEVKNARTGKTLATVPPPAGSANGFTGLEAAGDDRTFFLFAAPSFYELRLGANGKPVSLTKVLSVRSSGYEGPVYAVSPDATQIAYSTGTDVTVMSFATGASRTWISTVSSGVASLSWAGDRMLEFGWRANPDGGTRMSVRLLDTRAASSGLLASSRVIVPSSRVLTGGFVAVEDSMISPDGSVVLATFVNTENGQAQSNPAAEVAEFSVRTGRLLAVTPPVDEGGMGSSCMAVWSDPSGAQVVVGCNGVGILEHGRWVRADLNLPGTEFSSPVYIAW